MVKLPALIAPPLRSPLDGPMRQLEPSGEICLYIPLDTQRDGTLHYLLVK
jgi:hypothetical protein